jgi:hypothetical protein
VARQDIGRPEIRILESVNLFGQLTAEQLSRHLSYSFRYTQSKCKDLTDKKYLMRLTLPKRTQAGSVPYVYTLARCGRQYLGSQDEDFPPSVKKRYRPSEEQARLHSLSVNEVLLQFIKETETDPDLSLVRYIPEPEFVREPIKVSIPDRSGTQTVSLIPDLWLHVRQMIDDTPIANCFCVEVNLTPVEQKRWRRKVSMYLNCDAGYIKRIGVQWLQVLTIVNSPGTVLRRGAGTLSEKEKKERQKEVNAAEKTLRDYLQWTEKELVSQNRRSDADLFLFTSAPLDALSPKDLLFSKAYSIPFEPDTTSLFTCE